MNAFAAALPARRHVDRLPRSIAMIAPGVGLCAGLAGAAWLVQRVESRFFGRAWLEALVIAMLLGAGLRTFWKPGVRWTDGIAFSAKTLLECAIVLLGATMSSTFLHMISLALVAGVVGVVCASLTAGYAIGHLFGLSRNMAILVACGNAICGNSAILAVAPVIGAGQDEVGTSIAFTALMGVAVVVGLPIVALAWHMAPRSFGIVAGLTVYAVPQVLAATLPVGTIAAQMGTVIKLARVLLLGPVLVVLSFVGRPRSGVLATANLPVPAMGRGTEAVAPKWNRIVPWFILGFVALAAIGPLGILPDAIRADARRPAACLTVISMAALGLGVDARAVMLAGPRVICVVSLSLLFLIGLSILVVMTGIM